MNTKPGIPEILKRPSAYAPILMSLLALATIAAHVIRVGAARETDESAAAHLWQLLMIAQIPVIAGFAVKWWRRAPRNVGVIFALQLLAAAAAVAPVWFLRL